MSDDEPTIFLCMPVKDGLPATPSEMRECSDCGQDVWISHGTLAAHERIGGDIVCPDCAIKVATPEEISNFHLADEQINEIRAWAKLN